MNSDANRKDVAGIWYMLRSAEHFLYHYTSSSVLVKHILKTEQIRFSSFVNLNDPYEFKDLTLTWTASNGFGEEFSPLIQAEYADILRRDLRVACFSSDAAGCELTGDIGPMELTERPYRRGHSLAQMWAHYGENHAGACLVFDKTRLEEAITSCAGDLGLGVAHGEVAYRNWPAGILSDRLPRGFWASYDDWKTVGAETMARRHIEREWKSLFLSKTKAWEGEQEYRFLLWGRAPPEVYVPFGDALVGVLLGERFPPDLKADVGRYCLARDVSLASMDWLNGFPQPKPGHPQWAMGQSASHKT